MSEKVAYLLGFLLICTTGLAQKVTYRERYRPQIHFSPPAHWMNDPNGMVYYKGTYHLFYQYYPNGTVWGPMHWGHATSSDMIHWKNQPIALYPDSLGLIFSGSAVVDVDNTSGFGKNGKPPLVAIFTHHSQQGAKAGRMDFQNQSLAYSTDDGKTWTKYAHNPVLKNPGVQDFRDPNVFWFTPAKKWVMSLATKDRLTFYLSKDLKSWTKESEFGEHLGAHGGVWECPDLFPLTASDGKKLWVLIVNINPGGPAGGSATQYFTGDFDGKTFTPSQTGTRWLDEGTDEYAGVTWHNTGNRRIFLGWMSNWQYGQAVPTKPWRSAMTVPRELKLLKAGTGYSVASEPARELASLKDQTVHLREIKVAGDVDVTKLVKRSDSEYEISLSSAGLKSFALTLSNPKGEQLTAGYDQAENCWYIDRTKAGESGFNKEFAKKITARRKVKTRDTDVKLIIDAASVELFADQGLTAMTVIFFPSEPYNNISVRSKAMTITDLTYSNLRSIWH